jgi:hypothetical protein
VEFTTSGGERTRTVDFYVAKVVEIVCGARRCPLSLVRALRRSTASTRSGALSAFRCQKVASRQPRSGGKSPTNSRCADTNVTGWVIRAGNQWLPSCWRVRKRETRPRCTSRSRSLSATRNSHLVSSQPLSGSLWRESTRRHVRRTDRPQTLCGTGRLGSRKPRPMCRCGRRYRSDGVERVAPINRPVCDHVPRPEGRSAGLLRAFEFGARSSFGENPHEVGDPRIRAAPLDMTSNCRLDPLRVERREPPSKIRRGGTDHRVLRSGLVEIHPCISPQGRRDDPRSRDALRSVQTFGRYSSVGHARMDVAVRSLLIEMGSSR